MHDDLRRSVDGVADVVGTRRFAKKLKGFREMLDDALTEDRFDDVDKFLSQIEVEDHTDEVLVVLLEVTKDASDCLTQRNHLYHIIAVELTRRGKIARTLLAEC